MLFHAAQWLSTQTEVLCAQISVHRLYKHHLGPALPLPLRLWMLLPGLTRLAGDFGKLRFLLCPPTAVSVLAVLSRGVQGPESA